MAVFKKKEQKFNPHNDLRLQKVKYLHEGKVVKECSKLQYRESSTHCPEGYWYDISKDDRVIEITSTDELRRMGLEVSYDEQV